MQMLHPALFSKLALRAGIRKNNEKLLFVKTHRRVGIRRMDNKRNQKRDSPSGGLSGTDVKVIWADGTFSVRETKG